MIAMVHIAQTQVAGTLLESPNATMVQAKYISKTFVMELWTPEMESPNEASFRRHTAIRPPTLTST